MSRECLWPVLLLCTLAAGCDSGEDAEVQQPIPFTLAQLYRDRGGVSLDVDLDTHHLTLDYPVDPGCITLDLDAGATVNGEPMNLIDPGSGYASDEPPEDECQRPTWSFERRDAGEALTTFSLSDGTATFVATFANLDADRSLTGPTSVAGYGTLTAMWRPASDQLGPMTAYLETLDGNTRFDDLAVMIDEADSELSLVPGLHYLGPLTLHLSGTLQAGVVECTPAPLQCKAAASVGPGYAIAPTLLIDLTP